MPDIIQLLPDNVANQIAAGEVIQRPASVVKELMENSVDAGADEIKLVLKDAGKTLIQVVDNGCGMSETDARLSVERHATSKIRHADDLFAIQTMGFRGEALASIAAISHMEIKTKRHEDDLGTKIIIEGSEVKEQEPESLTAGSTISVKNLFFNVPARRNFLKSDNAEYRHILEQFQRIALVHSNIRFILINNRKPIYQLEKGNTKKRIVDIFGASYKKRLIPLESETALAHIEGYIGKPDYARKRRGEQYFFVNGRFIKHAYFNHAVVEAFADLLPDGHYPSYFIYFKLPSDHIDVNIHPTKTEVKFRDQHAIYSILGSAVKQAIGKFNLSPSIDFDVDPSMDAGPNKDPSSIKPPQIHIDPDYNPFNQQGNQQRIDYQRQKQNLRNWDQLYKLTPRESTNSTIEQESALSQSEHPGEEDEANQQQGGFLQAAGRFIVTNVKSGLMVIDQQAAHERILYERFLQRLSSKKQSSQQQLFPKNVTFSASDAELVREIIGELRSIGFDIKNTKENTFKIFGMPADINDKENIDSFLDSMIESYRNNQIEVRNDKNINLAYAMAKNMAIKKGKTLAEQEMQSIINSLFACSVPDTSPSGKPVVTIIKPEELESKFE